MKTIFLDYASTTPMSAVVRQAMEPYFTDHFYNPSALYLGAKEVKKSLDGARESVAQLLGVRPSEIVFAAGSTEANNLAIRGVMEAHKGAHCVVGAIEHESVLHTASGYNYSVAPVDEQGIIDVAALAALVQPDTVLVACMLANNEIGTVQPIAEIGQLVEKLRAHRLASGNKTPLYLHTDASQAYNYMQVLPHSLGADLVVISGSKIYGPKQSAVLYIKAGIQLAPQLTGGSQEWGVRAGTENVAGIMGLTAALQETAQLRQAEHKRLKALQDFFVSEMNQKLPQVVMNGSRKHRLPNNIHLTVPATDNETLIMQLDEAGIQAAAGSACSASSDEPSHVLKAIGLTDAEAQSSLRFSMGRATTKEHIARTVTELVRLLG